MRGCKRLKTISSNIFELEKLVRVQFPDCEGVTEFCDAGLMTRISRTIDDRSYLLTILIKVCGILVKLLTLCAEFFKSLKGVSLSFYHPGVCLNFDNCFSLDQNAQKLIIQSESVYSVLPGGEVPNYFRHRSCGSSLTIPLRKSYLLGFKVCLVLEASTVTDFDFPCVGVRWYLRGKTGVHRFHFHRVSVKRDHFKMDHLLVFRFGLPTEEVTESPPELDNHNVKFEFYYHIYGCSHKLDELTFHTEACPHSVQRIKGCGMQLWHVYSSPKDNDDETVEAYIDSSSSSEDEAEFVENFSMDDYDYDYESSSSSDDEEIFFKLRDNRLTDD